MSQNDYLRVTVNHSHLASDNLIEITKLKAMMRENAQTFHSSPGHVLAAGILLVVSEVLGSCVRGGFMSGGDISGGVRSGEFCHTLASAILKVNSDDLTDFNSI